MSEVLRHFISDHKLQTGMDKVAVADAWRNLMGNGVNSYTTEVLLKGKTLYVSLSSAVLREELSYGKTKMVQMLNEELGREIITEIILR